MNVLDLLINKEKQLRAKPTLYLKDERKSDVYKSIIDVPQCRRRIQLYLIQFGCQISKTFFLEGFEYLSIIVQRMKRINYLISY